VNRIRSGDALTQVSRRVLPAVQQVPGVTSAATMGILREAIRNDRTVLLGYAEQDGTASRHTVRPISMAGGVLRGYDGPDGRLHAFALHRITAVAPIREDELD
jgi:predicted DNA-binding transcriptional regulator YafY